MSVSNFIKFYHKIDETFEFEVFVALAVWASIVFPETHLGVDRNPYAKFQLNSSTGYRRDAIMGKKNPRWSTVAIFVDRAEPNLGVYN